MSVNLTITLNDDQVADARTVAEGDAQTLKAELEAVALEAIAQDIWRRKVEQTREQMQEERKTADQAHRLAWEAPPPATPET